MPVSELVEIVLHVGKGTKFGGEKVNGGQNICIRDDSSGNGKNYTLNAKPNTLHTKP